MRWIPFLLLLGCPVEPKDIQDLSQNNNPGPGKQNPQLNNGKPPGSPPKDQGDVVPTPPINPDAPGDIGAQNEGTVNPNRTDPNGEGNGEGAPGEGAVGEGEQPVMELQGEPEVQQGDVTTPTGSHPNEGPGMLPVNDGEVPTNENGNALPPATAGDVLPLYPELPTFTDVLDEADSVALTLTVNGASTFDFEFVVQREGEGRSFPKVIHKQSMATSPVTVQVPASYSEPVWLIITADRTGDGPTPDDLIAGTAEGMQFGPDDFSLEFTLSDDEDFLKQLPWFSQAADGPAFNGGL